MEKEGSTPHLAAKATRRFLLSHFEEVAKFLKAMLRFFLAKKVEEFFLSLSLSLSLSLQGDDKMRAPSILCSSFSVKLSFECDSSARNEARLPLFTLEQKCAQEKVIKAKQQARRY